MKQMKCRNCGATISYDERQINSVKCPYCDTAYAIQNPAYRQAANIPHPVYTQATNTPKKKPFYQKWWFWVIVVFLVLGSADTETDGTVQATEPTEAIIHTEETVAAQDQETEETLTMGQKNALGSAESYLRFSAFSYEGLIHQLEFEKYSHEEAVFAADNCGADWTEQAQRSAESYLSHSAFSYDGLLDQLEYEKFTSEQAQYAVDNCNADWYEQAAKRAKSYLSHSSFSREGLIDQLLYEGFTQEQAEYGVSQNGY